MHLSDYQISRYVDKSFSPEEGIKIKSHLNQCKKCFEKVLFLKRVLIAEENFFLNKPERNRFITVIKNKIRLVAEGLELLIKGHPLIREVSLSFRSSPVMKAIEIMGEPKIKVFYEDCIKIVCDEDLDYVKIETEKKEIFKGFLPANFEVKMEKNDIGSKFIISTQKNRIEFEIDV